MLIWSCLTFPSSDIVINNFSGIIKTPTINVILNISLFIKELYFQGPAGFARDCPLTVMGTLQATLVGNAMKENGISISHVYCSPSLRCIQTCHSLLKR